MTTQTILEIIERRMDELYGKLPDSETILNGTASKEDYRITGAYTELERLEKEIRTGRDETDIVSELKKYIKENFTIEKDVLDKYGMEEKDYMYTMDESDMLKMVSHFVEWKSQKMTKNND